MVYVFWLSIILVLASYAGYPLLLYVASLLTRNRYTTGEGHIPRATLIISAYNEEAVIESRIENALALDYPRDKLKIIVVSDGSSDGTDEIVAKYKPQGVNLVAVPGRRGKTHALNQVLPTVETEIVVFSDANTMYDSQAVKHLVAPFADARVGAACGELQLQSPDGAVAAEGIYWRYEQLVKALESKTGGLTTFNGAIYALRPQLHKTMHPGAANDFQHALQLARARKASVYCPLARATEQTGSSSGVEFRRRVRIVSRGWRALAANASVLNPFRVGLFSLKILLHKVLRWLGPVFLVAALVSNFFILQQPLYQVALAGQAAFYTLALLGGFVSFKPANIIAYFCVINIAAFWGLLRFVCGKDSATWAPTTHSDSTKAV